MTIGETIYSTLTTDIDVAAIVVKRVYPVVLPKKTLPAITYQRVSGSRENDLSSAGGLVTVRVQVDCWAEGYSSVRALASAASAALCGAGFLPVGDRDGFEDEVLVHRVILEFTKTVEA
jgi:hypothetical protein